MKSKRQRLKVERRVVDYPPGGEVHLTPLVIPRPNLVIPSPISGSLHFTY